MSRDILENEEPNSLRWKIARAREILQREGWRSYFYRIVARCGYRRVDWYVGDLARASPPPDFDCPFSIRTLAPEDLPAYLQFRPEVDKRVFLDRLSRGSFCHAAWFDERIVSATWVSIGEAYLEFFGRDFPMTSDGVYLFDSFTLRAFRGRRIPGLIYAATAAQLMAQGSLYAATFIEPKNRPMRRARLRDGFVRAGYASDFRLGPLHCVRDRREPWSGRS